MFKSLKRKDIRLSISTRIALLFCILTFVIVSLSTYLITTTLKTTLLGQKSDELRENTKRISNEFASFRTQSDLVTLAAKLADEKSARWQDRQTSFDIVDRRVRHARIPYYISYTVYFMTQDGTPVLLGSNDQFLPILPLTADMQPERHIEKSYYTDGDLNIL